MSTPVAESPRPESPRPELPVPEPRIPRQRMPLPATPVGPAQEQPVGLLEGVRRVAAGLGVAAAIHAVAGLLWPWLLSVSAGLMLLIALSWLDQPGDRRRWTALTVACGVALVVGVTATRLMPAGGDAFASQFAIAALAALPGGLAYALVTHRY